MPLVSSYHSKVSGETNYHNHSDCEEGNKIKSENRLQGTGKLLWCKHCSELLNNKKVQIKRSGYPVGKNSRKKNLNNSLDITSGDLIPLGESVK